MAQTTTPICSLRNSPASERLRYGGVWKFCVIAAHWWLRQSSLRKLELLFVPRRVGVM